MIPMSLRLISGLVALSAICIIALATNRSNAATTYLVQVQTRGLTPGAFYTLDFRFSDGGDGSNNVATISQLNFGTATPLELTADFSLVDAYPDVHTIDFQAQGIISFVLTLTTEANLGIAQPDSFLMNLFDGTGNAFNSQTQPLLQIDEPIAPGGLPIVQTFNSGGVTVSLVPIINYLSYSGDFNRDGKQDILWRNVKTGDVYIWLMNGASVIDAAFVGTADLSWTIAGVGNFDGSGKRDILWYNATQGKVVVWTMDGTTQTGAQEYQGPVSTTGEWVIAGVADFDHKGRDDILWQDILSGNIYIWKSVAPLTFNGIYLATVNPVWRIAGTADVEGNGRPDIIWRNVDSGEVVIWQLANDQVSAQVSLGQVSLEFQILGLADFNGDGKQDILWRSTITGNVYVWGMNGLSIGTEWYAGTSTLDWGIVGTPALFGPGSTNDLLWLNPSTGGVTVWTGSQGNFDQLQPFANAGTGYLPMPAGQ